MNHIVNITNDLTETVRVFVVGAPSQEDAIAIARQARSKGRGQAQAVLQDDTQNSRDDAYVADLMEDVGYWNDESLLVDMMRDEFLAALEQANSARILKRYDDSASSADPDTLMAGHNDIRMSPEFYAGAWELTDLGRSLYTLDPTPVGVEGSGFKVRITRTGDPSDTQLVLLELQVRQKVIHERTLAPSFIIESN